tara:strand:+ start:2828 stop:3022 length:195 start_codon:yes stop_codon:yes gene_type:complete
MSSGNKVSQSEINKRLKHVKMEADFRFMCLEIATPFSKDIEGLIENATKLYNYSFHIPPKKDDE